jgi:hypothetical protein
MRMKTIIMTVVAAIAVLCAAACAGLGSSRVLPLNNASTMTEVNKATPPPISVLKILTKQLIIGSTIDPENGDQNPYGLAVAQSSGFGGKVKKGNVYVCNFNDKANTQGTGTTIVTLPPTTGAKPVRFAQSDSLLGCAAIAISALADATTYAAAFGSKAEVAIASTGRISAPFKKGLTRPFGVTWAVDSLAGISSYATYAVFVSDAQTGSIVLAKKCTGTTCTYPGTPVVTGFAVNHGAPGSILGPSGLTFDLRNCVELGGHRACGTLYVVDGVTNTVVAIHNALNLRDKRSIIVEKSGTKFRGKEKSWASLVYSGSPLDGPISAALLYNGNLVVGNTLNKSGENLLVELSPGGKLLDVRNVDKGPAGALFGIATTGNSATTQKVYFNDDNANNVQVLEE